MFGFFRKNDSESIDINELDKLLGKVNLIDIREPHEYKSGHLPTARNIPMDKLLSEAEHHLDISQQYHIICQSGARSAKICGMLKEKGYQVVNVKGGTGAYGKKLEL